MINNIYYILKYNKYQNIDFKIKKMVFFVIVSAPIFIFVNYFYNYYIKYKPEIISYDDKILKEIYGPNNTIWFSIKNHLIHDFVITRDKKYIFFSEKKAGIIGRITLESGKITFSKPYYYGAERIAIDNNDNNFATFTKLGKSIAILSNIDSMEPIIICDKYNYYGSFNYIIYNKKLDKYLATRENQHSLCFFEYKNCKQKNLTLKTFMPVSVICAEELDKCYVSGWFYSNTLSEVKIGKNGLPESVRGLFLGPFSWDMALDEVGKKLYIVRPLIGCIDVVDISSFRRIKRIPSASMTREIAVAPELDLLFIAEYLTGTIHIHNISSGKELAHLQVGRYIRKMIWDKDLQTLFISDLELIYSVSKADLLSLTAQ